VNVDWSLRAIRDVRNLHEYLTEVAPNSADTILGRIRASILTLEQFPLRGREGRVPGTRELYVPRTPYIVAYRVRGNVVQIGRVLHSSQRWPEMI
jgi:toxin ParE1/3/4